MQRRPRHDGCCRRARSTTSRSPPTASSSPTPTLGPRRLSWTELRL